MDLYHIALFLHIMALVVASGATAVMKLAASRLGRARTVADALEWHGVQSATAKLFPLMLAVFFITGGYMVSRGSANIMSAGFVVAGIFGVAFLLVSGTYLGVKGKALGGFLQSLAANDANAPAPKLVPPPILTALPIINTFVALSVAFDMVTKPASIATALTVIAVGIALGAIIGFRPVGAPKAARAM